MKNSVGIATKENFVDNHADALPKIPLFWGIHKNNLSSLLTCLAAKVASYGKNQPVFLEGDKAEFVGIVLSGAVQIVKDDYYGKRNILSSVPVGGLFAEAFACADSAALPISVFATEKSDVLLINCKKIVSTCQNSCAFHSRLIYNLLRCVASRNLELVSKIEFTAKRTTREKLLAYLAAQAKKSGRASFSIPFKRQELADYLGVERSAMSAELGRMREDGIVEFSKNKFTLL